MYKELLNLSKLPFENVSDPDFFYDSGDFSRVFANLMSSLQAGRGLMVVTGAIGSGKTTLSQMVMNEYSESLKLIWMAEPPESGKDVLIFIARELGLTPSDENRVFLISDIRSALLSCDERCLLILDEAHLMSDDVVHTLKTLNNLELLSKKLMQMFLLGQDELLEIINRPEMLPFKQRIALLEIIGRMERKEIRDYIRFRMSVAGGDPDIFTKDAIESIAIGSGGAPRVINSLCDKALYHAGSRNSQTVEVVDVYDAAQGLVDRKDIFQFMLSVRNQPVRDDEKSDSTVLGEMADTIEAPPTSATNDHPREFKDETGSSLSGKVRSHPDGLSAPAVTMTSADDIDAWEARSYNSRRGMGAPLLHLVLSVIALAGSLFYFAEISATGLDGLFEAILSMIIGRS
jgi:MSHA biogenesis protein MshM